MTLTLPLRTLVYVFSCIMSIAFSIPGQAQCGNQNYPAPSAVLANVPEAAGYNFVYGLPIPSANQQWLSQADVPYSVNNAAALGSTPFTKVAYYLKLESPTTGVQWVWVSMNAFTTDIGRIGIPTGTIRYQQQVTNMNVVDPAGTNRTGVAGNIEFWPDCYYAQNSAGVPNASDAVFDFGDKPTTENCNYGSFQVHDFNAMETLLSYNGWSSPDFTSDDLGIGNCASCSFPNNTDWTFGFNASAYQVKELYVFVNKPAYQPQCNNASLLLNSNGSAILSPSMVTPAIIGNCGVQNIQLSKTNFSCSDIGSNTVTVTFTVNGNTSTCTSQVTVIDNIAPLVTATGTAVILGCNPTAAAIESGLGTATATDNCGMPQLTVSTGPVVVVNPGTSSQSRTFTAKDNSNNTSSVTRTVTWTTNCTTATPHIFSMSVSCKEFIAGADPLLNVCYTVENRRIKKVTPHNFYYYTKVTAPAMLGPGNSFYTDIIQSKTCAAFKLYGIQGNQVRAYDMSCNKITNGSEVSDGQGRIRLTGATPGRVYIISVKYSTKSLEGLSTGSSSNNCENNFVAKTTLGSFGSGTIVPNSQGSIKAKAGCSVPNDDDDDDHDDDDDFSNKASSFETDINNKELTVSSSPNPASTHFILSVKSNASTPVSVRITDITGRPVYNTTNLNMKNALYVGHNWQPGTYFAEVIQDKKRQVIKLIKL